MVLLPEQVRLSAAATLVNEFDGSSVANYWVPCLQITPGGAELL